jgi:hypothetical protein
MASDQVVIALGILAVAGPIVTTGVTLWFQGKRDKDARADEAKREQLRKRRRHRTVSANSTNVKYRRVRWPFCLKRDAG